MTDAAPTIYPLRIPSALRHKLDTIALFERRPLSWVILNLLESGVESRKLKTKNESGPILPPLKVF